MNVRLVRRGLVALSAVLALVVVMAAPASASTHDGEIEELEFCLGTAPNDFCFELPSTDPTPCPDTPDPSVAVDLTQTGPDTADIDDVDVSSLSNAEIPDSSGDWYEVELIDSSFGSTGGDIDLNRTPQVEVDVTLEGFITAVDDTDEECPTVGNTCWFLIPLHLEGSYSGNFLPPTATIQVSGGGTVNTNATACPIPALLTVLDNAPADVINLEMLFD